MCFVLVWIGGVSNRFWFAGNDSRTPRTELRETMCHFCFLFLELREKHMERWGHIRTHTHTHHAMRACMPKKQYDWARKSELFKLIWAISIFRLQLDWSESMTGYYYSLHSKKCVQMARFLHSLKSVRSLCRNAVHSVPAGKTARAQFYFYFIWTVHVYII